ncbi:MAG: hypothetical protein PHV20_00325 [Bacteroidales bacterium]|nr:hypothetical protein [Bacteroidales bacterium]
MNDLNKKDLIPVKKWYKRIWLVIILCILVYPLGIYGLWKTGSMKTFWKVVIAIVLGWLSLVFTAMWVFIILDLLNAG